MPDTSGITPDLLLALLVIWLGPAVVIAMDVRHRGGRGIVWATEWLIVSLVALIVLRPLFWLVANAAGLLLYLLVRPKGPAATALPAGEGGNGDHADAG